MFQLAKQTVGWGKQPSKAPAAGSAVGKRPYASNIAPSLLQSNLPPSKEAHHGGKHPTLRSFYVIVHSRQAASAGHACLAGAARAPFYKTSVMEAAPPGAKKPRREQQVRGRHLYALFSCVHPAADA